MSGDSRPTVTPPLHSGDMTSQLLLLEDSPRWRLNSETREQGLRGIANARAVLREAQAKARAEALESDPEPLPDAA